MRIGWRLSRLAEQLVGDVIFTWIAVPVTTVICAVIYTILTIIGLPPEVSIVLPLGVMIVIVIAGHAYYQRLLVGPRTVKFLKRLLKAIVSKLRKT